MMFRSNPNQRLYLDKELPHNEARGRGQSADYVGGLDKRSSPHRSSSNDG